MFLLLLTFLFNACLKEYSYERRIAKGFLIKTAGNCQSPKINGQYKPNTPVSNNHYVIVQVHFTRPGRYKISTDIRNGFSFQDSAEIKDTGYHEIKLKATGRPLISETTEFIVFFDSSLCSFSVPVSNNVVNYSITGSAASCSNATIQGSYKLGEALSFLNKVTLQVNVIDIGSYSITTDKINGIEFSASGNFTITGVQTVVLQGYGTPTVKGSNTIPVTAGSSNCSFNVIVSENIDPSSLNRLDSAWQFNQGEKNYRGYFDGATTHMLHDTTVLTLVGLTPAQDKALAIVVYFSASATIKTGVYKSPVASSFLFFDRAGNTIFTSHTNANVQSTVVIAYYDHVTKVVEGTFSGTVLNGQNQAVPIVGGKFKAKLN